MSDTTGLNASDAARALTISDIVVTLMSVASNEHCQCLIPEFAIEWRLSKFAMTKENPVLNELKLRQLH